MNAFTVNENVIINLDLITDIIKIGTSLQVTYVGGRTQTVYSPGADILWERLYNEFSIPSKT